MEKLKYSELITRISRLFVLYTFSLTTNCEFRIGDCPKPLRSRERLRILYETLSVNNEHPRGGGYYNGLYGVTTPERGTFFTLQRYERVGFLQVEVYERVGKSVI